jgi:hypothetical protein
LLVVFDRLRDARRLEAPSPVRRFVEAALRKRGERRPRNPRVSVASVEDLLRSANRLFHVAATHREGADPGSCRIDRVHHVDHRRVTLLGITPDATWEEKPGDVRLAEITRVDFGGDFEDALYAVGGEPPRV